MYSKRVNFCLNMIVMFWFFRFLSLAVSSNYPVLIGTLLTEFKIRYMYFTTFSGKINYGWSCHGFNLC